jgi:hypothetical protein
MRIVFTGPEAGRTIVATGQRAPRGQAVDVRDDVAEELVGQPAWREATKADVSAYNGDGDAAGGVPGGNVDQVLEWVGDDPQRARQAIEAERESDRPRSTLITAASEIIDAAGSSDH